LGTNFAEIYDEFMLPIINDYKVDKIYMTDRDVAYEYLCGFLKNGLSDFDCIKPLTYTKSIVEDEDTGEQHTEYVFDYDLDMDEKKIIGEIAVSKYFKRLTQDVKARLPYMSQREFKKDAIAPIMKQNDNWYSNLVSEYQQDIYNYHIKHLNELPYWSDLF
jgi:hypothetical protein